MRLNSKDWKKLQWPIFLLVTVVVFGIVLLTYASHYHGQQLTALRNQQDALLVAKQKYLSSGTEKQQIEALLPQYQTLINQGFIGEEHRQTWIQALHNIQHQYKLFPIRYQLAPLEQKSVDFIQSVAPFTLHQSTMTLDFDLLHEGDLLTITESLNEHVFNHWLLRGCTLSRLKETKPNGATMSGQCHIEWYTLVEPNQK